MLSIRAGYNVNMSTEIDIRSGADWFVAAREIKRRGIAAFDDVLREGPIHVIKNDRLTYVIMREEDYAELMNDAAEASEARIKESLKNIERGEGRIGTAAELIAELRLDDTE
ncbi:MAG TPA: prevent-host-death protein [Dehalococcoidia bacterium]